MRKCPREEPEKRQNGNEGYHVENGGVALAWRGDSFYPTNALQLASSLVTVSSASQPLTRPTSFAAAQSCSSIPYASYQSDSTSSRSSRTSATSESILAERAPMPVEIEKKTFGCSVCVYKAFAECVFSKQLWKTKNTDGRTFLNRPNRLHASQKTMQIDPDQLLPLPFPKSALEPREHVHDRALCLHAVDRHAHSSAQVECDGELCLEDCDLVGEWRFEGRVFHLRVLLVAYSSRTRIRQRVWRNVSVIPRQPECPVQTYFAQHRTLAPRQVPFQRAKNVVDMHRVGEGIDKFRSQYRQRRVFVPCCCCL
jgi:hypothetical protein